jgi:DNA-binding CsgD family transcriptional regulator
MAGSSYPSQWRARYLRLGYEHHDPLLRAGSTMRRAFTWGGSDYVSRLEGKARQMFEEASAFGIGGGVSVPVYGPGGDRGLLSLSGRSGAASSAIVREYLPLLHLVAHQAHAAMMERLMPPADGEIRLTQQERECLTWTLRGKTAWEIAQIIGRSRATVNFHLQKSLRKLGTSSKYQAATKAMQAGLI